MQSVAKILMAAAMAAFAGIANAESNSEIALLFGRSEAVSDPKLSPDGHYVGMRCAPQVQPALCIFDVVGGGEPVVAPPQLHAARVGAGRLAKPHRRRANG